MKLELLIESADQSSFASKISSDMIKYIESRQGKDIKTYIQIAPFHMKIVGLPNNKVSLLCKLAEICKIMTIKATYLDEDLHSLNQKIDDYLQSAKDIFPDILQKVKTHLSTHIVDDIRMHGPPSAYQEDAFEKMHGRIRDQLFLQNQHAKSRDTALAFAEMEILHHVITGGYFKMLGGWVNAANNVEQMAMEKEVTDFLGYPRISVKQTGVLVKANRSTSQKKIKHTFEEESEAIISSCDRLGLQLPMDLKKLKSTHFKAVTCVDGFIANCGNPVLYEDQEKKSIGIFVYGTEFTLDGRSVQLAVLKKIKEKSTLQLTRIDIERVKILQEHVVVKASNILQIVCLVHDCLNAFCYYRHCDQTVTTEQETKTVKKWSWIHRENNHPIYFVNPFRFSHRFQ